MVKEIFIVLVLIFAMTNSACSQKTDSANNNMPNRNSESDNQKEINNSERDFNVKNQNETESKNTQKPFFVILGNVIAEGGKIELEGDFWGHSWSEEEAKFYPDDKVEIDLMNCAGYLASATTTYKRVAREVKLIDETIASDAVEKIRQCSDSPHSEIISSKVFGIAPQNKNRKNIKIGGVDLNKIYSSIAKDIKDSKKQKSGKSETKSSLSLKEDNWTDLDGDGLIDLVEFHGTPCDEKDTCTWIYRLINGKWKEIDYVNPL